MSFHPKILKEKGIGVRFLFNPLFGCDATAVAGGEVDIQEDGRGTSLGGLLAEVLSRLATYLENTARLRKKVKSAMMYPTAVTVIAIGITIPESFLVRADEVIE